jgi:N-alpha-acetyl-L-2,4-diaminobutyrate deacetylase
MVRSDSGIIDLPRIDFGQKRQSLHMRFAVTIGGERREHSVPVLVWGQGSGPGTLVMAGQHGNEYQGVLILQRILQRLGDRLAGNLVVIPTANPSALAAATRASPHDGLDLNRSFPGRADGSHSEQIAHAISTAVLPHVDAILDIHSGGYSTAIMPSVMMHDLPDKMQFGRMVAASRGFEVPWRVIIDETHKPGMFDSVAESQGKLFFCPELGGGSLSRDVIDGGTRLVETFLATFGHLPGLAPAAVPSPLMHVPDQEHWTRATQDGVFSPLVAPGHSVVQGQLVGELIRLDDPTGPAVAVPAPRTGAVYMVKVGGRARVGDSLIVVAAVGEEGRL